ncbi:MAG: hypothetical protein WCH99_12390 [Verrucomicrobiota bacterium]
MAKAKTKTETKTSRRWLLVTLTKEELLAAGKLQADKSLELAVIEGDRKRVADDFKAKTSAIEADLASLAGKISTGYEFRYVNCTEYLGEPAPDKKRVVRQDTLEVVGEEDMTQAEMQRELVGTEAPACNT